MKKYIDEQKIKDRVKHLGTSITKNYNDKSKLTILCVLKGSFIFAADLIREIDLDLSIEFIDISSYDGTSRGELILNKGVYLREKIVINGGARLSGELPISGAKNNTAQKKNRNTAIPCTSCTE